MYIHFLFKGIQQLHRFKIKHPNIDIEPHISKTTKYCQDYIHRKLSAIEDNLRSCLIEPNGMFFLVYKLFLINDKFL